MNRNKLCITVCAGFVNEVHLAVSMGNHPDVVVRAFGGNCSNCPKCRNLVEEFIEKNRSKFHKIIIYTGTCVASISKEYNNVRIIKSDLCFDLLLPRFVADHFISKGYYLINSGKLRRVENLINDWGFTPEIAKSFFTDSAKAILLIDTGTDPKSNSNKKILSDYTGLPIEVLNAGVDYCKLFINEEILRWRDEKAQSELFDKLAAATAKTADYAMVFQQINSLVQISDEENIIHKVFELMNLLFGPENIIYYPYLNNCEGKAIAFHNDKPIDSINKEADIIIELQLKAESFGRFEVVGLAFPQYKDNYHYSAQIIANVCSLAIANARKFNELKEATRIAQEYSSELKQTNAEKDKFFSIIAHDLRSPFTGFLLFSQMLAEQTEDLTKEEIQEYGRSLFDSANNLFSLLENLLQWARMKRGVTPFKPESYELFLLIDQAIDLHLDTALHKTIVIENHVPEDVFVNIDVLMISSVLRNLITNAIKFTPRGGKIRVEYASDEANNHCIVSIADSGIGIVDELLSKLFKIDERVSREGTEGEPSSGLGLLLCKEFIEIHDCRLWVESTVGVGSRFSFTLPLLKGI